LAQQIVAGLNLGGLAQAIKGLQDTVKAMDERLKSLEDIGQDEGLSPLIPMPQSAFWRATQMAKTETQEAVVKAAAPTLPDAIAEMAKLVPIA
jgi:hypothetical protein